MADREGTGPGQSPPINKTNDPWGRTVPGSARHTLNFQKATAGNRRDRSVSRRNTCGLRNHAWFITHVTLQNQRPDSHRFNEARRREVQEDEDQRKKREALPRLKEMDWMLFQMQGSPPACASPQAR